MSPGRPEGPRLDHAAIASLVPHHGSMCLLAAARTWDAGRIVCTATNHRDPGHPLRTARGLAATALVEYAAQAAALHGGVLAQECGERAPPGLLASARDVQLERRRLDDLPAADPDELVVVAERQAGDASRILYAWHVTHDGAPVGSGRLAVVLQPSTPT